MAQQTKTLIGIVKPPETIIGTLKIPELITRKITKPKTLKGVISVPYGGYTGSGGEGVGDYTILSNKPKINDHQLSSGNNSLQDLGIGLSTNRAIDRLF